jgi:uroporphyrinogen-III synthase
VVNTADGAETWRADIATRAVDAVTFASPSAVSGLRAALNDTAFAQLEGLVVAAIGATTAAALRQSGLTVTTVARRSTLEDLAAATLAALKVRTSAPKEFMQ